MIKVVDALTFDTDPIHSVLYYLALKGGFNSLTYTIYLKINTLSLLSLLILKIRTHLLFDISTISLFIELKLYKKNFVKV